MQGKPAQYLFSYWPLFIILPLIILEAVYIDENYPYQLGKLKMGQFTLDKTETEIPLQSTIYHPLQNGNFSVILFVGGLYGLLPEIMYQNITRMVATHGFIIVSINFIPYPFGNFTNKVPDQVKNEQYSSQADQIYQEIEWLQKNLDAYLMKENPQFQVNSSWENLALLCHSAGCDTTIQTAINYHQLFKASVFLEPFSFRLVNSINYSLPALMYGTELSQKFPPCSIAGLDFAHFYEKWTCPRILIEAAGVGHCDILDPLFRTMCGLVCHLEQNDDSESYKMSLQGLISAFFISEVQGFNDLKYIADESQIPLKLLQHKVDVSPC